MSYANALKTKLLLFEARLRTEENSDGWDSDNANLLVVLENRISPNIISEMESEIGTEITCSEMWDWLLGRYDSGTSNDEVASIKHEMESSNLSSFSNLELYISAMGDVFSRYIAAGADLTDADRKMYFLRGISGSLRQSASTLEILGD